MSTVRHPKGCVVLALAITLTVAIFAAPPSADGQQPGKLWRVGHLTIGPRAGPPGDPTFNALTERLRGLGYVEGQNFVFEWRSFLGKPGGWSEGAGDLVKLNVDVILVPSTQPAMAVKQLTTTIPVVTCAASDVVETGLVTSLARPGGNITGLTVSGAELSRKRLEFLKEAVPELSVVAVLADPTNATHALFWTATEIAARAARVRVYRVDAQTPEEFTRAFDSIAKLRPGGLIVFPEPLSYAQRKRIGEFVVNQRLPAMFALRGHVLEGGLMSYAPSYPDLYRRCATYLDKILKGAKPSELPIEEPTTFEFVINLKVAKALGLTIPPSLLLRADEIIQ